MCTVDDFVYNILYVLISNKLLRYLFIKLLDNYNLLITCQNSLDISVSYNLHQYVGEINLS